MNVGGLGSFNNNWCIHMGLSKYDVDGLKLYTFSRPHASLFSCNNFFVATFMALFMTSSNNLVSLIISQNIKTIIGVRELVNTKI